MSCLISRADSPRTPIDPRRESPRTPGRSRTAWWVTGGVAATLMLGVTGARAQAGTGAAYGARDPHTCPDRTAPVRGAITPALAAEYVRCSEESVEIRSLVLVEKVKVQVAAPRPYEARADGRMSDIDPGQPVYAIRGSYERYRCDAPHAAIPIVHAPSTIGKNCRVVDQPHATGACYKTTFHDWQCFMKDYDSPLTAIATDAAPPH